MAKISVIVPCFKQAQYLDECLQSVLDQTYQDWECIIVNDGSPDNTEDVAKIWVDKDVRFKYLHQENKGVSAARNFGIENAKGEWILPLDGDDKIAEKYLELASRFFENQKTKLIYCNAEKFGFINETWNLPEFNLKRLSIQNLIFVTAFFRKADYNKNCCYDENLSKGLEDWDFWISLLKNGGEVMKLDYIGFYYRIKEVSRNTKLLEDSDDIFKYIEKKHIDFFHAQLGSMNQIYHENINLKKVNQRFFNRIVNKIYALIDNFSRRHF